MWNQMGDGGMKIVVLDGYTLNPGDLNWDGLKNLGELTVHDHTPFDKVVEYARDAEVLFTNKTPVGEAEISQLKELKYVGVLATGYNIVDIAAAKKRDIIVTNIPTYGTRSVAQMAFALLLEMTQHAQRHSDAVHSGEWTGNRDFCFWRYPLIELEGKTMGIIGFGRIGEAVADMAQSFGMNVLGFDNYKSDQSGRKNFKWAELDELLGESDVVSLHCPLFPETKGIINQETLSKMKKSAFLINTSRGPLIVDEDLAEALNHGVIASAGLDVLSVEPPKADNPLLTAKNCLITPHISWATREARARLMNIAVENLEAFLMENPFNVVNK
jgi:glycerate dehydrogenase